jgi:hypothetical protein
VPRKSICIVLHLLMLMFCAAGRFNNDVHCVWPSFQFLLPPPPPLSNVWRPVLLRVHAFARQADRTVRTASKGSCVTSVSGMQYQGPCCCTSGWTSIKKGIVYHVMPPGERYCSELPLSRKCYQCHPKQPNRQGEMDTTQSMHAKTQNIRSKEVHGRGRME